MIKKIVTVFGLAIFSLGYSQVQTNENMVSTLKRTNFFLDASLFNGQSDKSVGKLLGFPSTDLKTFEFKTQVAEDEVVTSFFDGVIVYNTATGKTGANPATQGIQVDVEPGFYYFYNPNGVVNGNVNEGRWVRIGGGVATSSSTANKVSGTFNLAVGTNNVVLSAMPEAADIKAIKTINIYRTDENGKLEGGVVANTLYSYDEATKKAVFGTGVISSSLPAGNYAYEVEYIK